MPVESFYKTHQGEHTLGMPAVVSLVGGWLDTRKAMNDEARAGEEDPADIAKMEMEARRALGDMQQTLARVRSMKHQDEAGILRDIIKGKVALTQTSAETSADVQMKKLGYKAAMMDLAGKRADVLAADADIRGAERYDALATVMADDLRAKRTPAEVVARMAASFNSLAGTDKAGRGTTAFAARARRVYSAMVAAGNVEAADQWAAAVGASQTDQDGRVFDPNEVFLRDHTALTPEEVDEQAEEFVRRYSGGADTNAITKELDRLGVDYSNLTAGGGGSSVSVSGGGGDGEPRARGGTAGVKMAGLPPVAGKAAADTLATTGDPYAAMQAGIDAMAAYADDLAARRKAAGTRSRFPRANPYLANPNEYVSARGISAAKRIGAMDPGLARERSDALARNGQNWEKADAEVRAAGANEARFAPKEYDPETIRSGDLGSVLAGAFGFGAVNVNDPDGQYAYRVEPDLSITITKGPNGVGTKIAPGSDQWAGMVKVLGNAHPGIGALVTIGKQPAEVQELFAEARKAAASGDPKRAAELARAVSPNDVRIAYGRAMRRAESDPSEMGRLADGIAVLPEKVTEGWGDKFNAIIDTFQKGVGTGGYLAHSQASGSVGSLGRAMMLSGDVRAERRAERVAVSRDNLMDAAKKREEAEAKAAKMVAAGHGSTVAKQMTGRLQMEKPAASREDVKVGGDVANARDWRSQRPAVVDPGLDAFIGTDEPADRDLDFDAFLDDVPPFESMRPKEPTPVVAPPVGSVSIRPPHTPSSAAEIFEAQIAAAEAAGDTEKVARLRKLRDWK